MKRDASLALLIIYGGALLLLAILLAGMAGWLDGTTIRLAGLPAWAGLSIVTAVMALIVVRLLVHLRARRRRG